MSAATPGSVAAKETPRRRTGPESEPLGLRLLEWGTFLVTICIFAALALTRDKYFGPPLSSLIPWLFLVILADLLVVPVWGDVQLALSLPLLLSAAMVLPPLAAALLAFIGYWDLREFRREISLGHGLFNRSQVVLSVVAASWVFHTMEGDLQVWPFVMLAACLAVLADMLVNGSFVVIAWRLTAMGSFEEALSGLSGGRPIPFILSYLTLGLAGVLLAHLVLPHLGIGWCSPRCCLYSCWGMGTDPVRNPGLACLARVHFWSSLA